MEVSHKTGLISGIVMLAFILSMPGAAMAKDSFTVTLNSGTTFETLRQPQVAPWDRDVILVLTDVGNWIAMAKAEVQSITASVERSGLGTIIDSKTIAIGRLHDSDELKEEGEGKEGKGGVESQLDGFLNQLQDLAAPNQPVYNTEQFVNPEEAGGTAGFPASFAIEP